MINNILKKFCAEEVLILVNHMEEHFEDFDDYGSSQWSRILSACNDEDRLTLIERTLVSRVCKHQRKIAKRKRLLGRIIKEKIAPEELIENPVEDTFTYSSANRYSQLGNQAFQNLLEAKISQMQQEQADGKRVATLKAYSGTGQ